MILMHGTAYAVPNVTKKRKLISTKQQKELFRYYAQLQSYLHQHMQ